MPRSAIVWSVEYDSIEAFESGAPLAGATRAQLDASATPPTDGQLEDARAKAGRMIADVGADCTIAMTMDANGVMSIAVNRKA
jgi:hypothetical protein